MSDKGFIVIDRCVREWKWFGISNAMNLWFYLLVNAQWKDSHFLGHEVPRGSLWTSVGRIASETDMSEKTVRNWLKKFEEAGQIIVKGANKGTLISVINYAKYQDRTDEKGKQITEQVTDQTTEQVTKRVTDIRTNKQRNKETIREIHSSNQDSAEVLNDVDYWFDEFWKVYPRKQSKKDAKRAFTKACKTEEQFHTIMAGLRSVIETDWNGKDPKYIPPPATWLNGRRWEDEPLPQFTAQKPQTTNMMLEFGKQLLERRGQLPHDD